MKNNIRIFILILYIIPVITGAYAQEQVKNITTSEFKVSGVCNSCKTRIENAALIKGVKSAEWNKNTQVCKVTFDAGKTTEDAIQKAIAESGHDTESVKATDEAYNKLPKCCAYRNNTMMH